MRKSGSGAALGLAVCITVVAGCRGGGSPSPSNSATGLRTVTPPVSSRPGGAEAPTSAAQDKCRIVSASAMTAAIGGKLVAETSGLSGVGNAVCMFEFTRTRPRQDTRITLSANQSGNRAAFSRTKARTPKAQTVGGVGDAAFFVKATSTLQLLEGAKVVIIQATPRLAGSSGSVPLIGKAVLVKIAKAVLSQ
jgi:hypothetical protein